ncbi:MAG: hypothetical protein WD872_06870 [Pirellulaceae bacterium]
MIQRKSPRAKEIEPQPLSPWVKALLSGLIAVHVAAVFWGPFAFACNVGLSSSPLADPVARVLRPYTSAMFLDHGYFFFAPDPGPSHLVRYRLEFADGREPVEGVFPNLRQQWPRLSYHRHFMLSEALYNQFTPPTAPPKPTPPPVTAPAAEKARYRIQTEDYRLAEARWRHQRNQYEALWQAFEEHLKHEHGATRVVLTRVEHRPALPGEVRFQNRRLDAEDSYLELPETPPRGLGQ